MLRHPAHLRTWSSDADPTKRETRRLRASEIEDGRGRVRTERHKPLRERRCIQEIERDLSTSPARHLRRATALTGRLAFRELRHERRAHRSLRELVIEDGGHAAVAEPHVRVAVDVDERI